MRFNYKKLGKILKKRREELQLSTRKLAELINGNQCDVSRIENGLKSSISIELLIKICEILALDFFSLLDQCNFIHNDNLESDDYDSINNVEVDDECAYTKTYKVALKKTEERNVTINARTEDEAISIAEALVFNLNLFALEKKENDKELLAIEAVEI